MVLKAPFPYFGGKRRVASLVWERFGDVANFVEPFFGSGAVLLGRPHPPRLETVNDADCYLANFWRAVQHDPDAVAFYADWPVNEADLHARHRWLVTEGAAHVERLKTDPDYYDPKIAGWWVWGQSCWIGSGWCVHPEWKQRPPIGSGQLGVGVHSKDTIAPQQRPHLSNGPRGVHAALEGSTVTRQIPHLSGDGSGIHQQRPQLSHGGNGIRAVSLAQQIPHVGDSGRGVARPDQEINALTTWMRDLSDRLRRVRVCCGDWSRVMGPSVTFGNGLTAVFLDPPYDQQERATLYSVESVVSADVRAWAIANGDNPLLRIALCGYQGEHEMPDSWEVVEWKANGGYGNQGEKRGRDNAHRERIWFSPHCLKGDRPLQAAFDFGGDV